MLKFQIFRTISFEDIILGSWSGLNLNFAKIAGHEGPLELGRYISPSSKQILTCDGNKDCF